MITFVVTMRVAPENAGALAALIGEVARLSLAEEPGVIHYGFGEGVDEPGTFVVVEVYADAEAQAAHMQTQWVRDSLPQSMALIEGKPEIRQYVTPGTRPVTARVKL